MVPIEDRSKNNYIYNDHYIPESINKLHDCYVSLAICAKSIAHLLSNGMSPQKILKNDKLNQDVKDILPEMTEFIDQYGRFSWIFCIDIVRKKLKTEIASFVNQTQSDTLDLEIFAKSKNALASDSKLFL